MPRATFVQRLLAIIIDGLILIVPILVVSFLFTAVIGVRFGPLVAQLAIVAIVIAYYFLTEVKTGATIGKNVMKLKVADISGSPATKDQLVLRCGFKMLTFPLSILAALVTTFSLTLGGLIGYVNLLVAIAVLVSFLMALRATGLAWHDELFKTQVVNTAGVMTQGVPVQPPVQSPVMPPQA